MPSYEPSHTEDAEIRPRRGLVLSSRGTTVLPAPASRGGRRVSEGGLRWAGVLVAVAGALLLLLAAGDALAGVELGGGGDNTLRGSERTDRLVGFNGEDALYGSAGGDTLYGGAGKDEVYAGEGGDVVLAGAGDDFIEAKDGAVDRVGCGPGDDSISADREDLVSPDCESVYAG
jgi:Ca2+-binding RTX toxin-like protein